MKYRLHITEEAFEDMSNIYRYIFDTLQAPNAAKKQYNRIVKAIESLKLFPYRIKTIDVEEKQHLELRQLIVDNYSVIFTIREDGVVVLSVLYSASDIGNRLRNT